MNYSRLHDKQSGRAKWFDLALEFRVSDTYAGRNASPTAPDTPDIDVLLEVNLARLALILDRGSADAIQITHIEREFGIGGRGIAVGQHLARIINHWSKEHAQLLKQHDKHIGLFINAAPRRGQGRSAPEFGIAETDSNVRIVSPKEGINLIADDITRYREIPNRGSGLWVDGDQHRSRVAHNALVCEEDIALRDIPLAKMQANRERFVRKVRYVDVHGNIVTYGDPEGDLGAKRMAEAVRQRASQVEKDISIVIGSKRLQAKAAIGLESGNEGDIIAYANGGNPDHPNIDVVRKYDTESKDAKESAYAFFDEPTEGVAEVHIHIPD